MAMHAGRRLSHLADRLLSPHQAFPVGGWCCRRIVCELSSQIYEESRKFAYQTGLRPVVVYGQGRPRRAPGVVTAPIRESIGPRSDQIALRLE